MFDAESSWVSRILIVMNGEAPGDNVRAFWEESMKKWTSLGFDEISRKKLTCAVASGKVYGNYDRKK